MEPATLIPVYAGLLVTGFVSSLHCVGMCGPILIGFSQVFERVDLTIDGRHPAHRHRWDFVWYHAGRIWTYAAMGFLVGLLGQTLHHGWSWVGWQRVAGMTLSVVVILSGIALLGLVPGLRVEALLHGCAVKKWTGATWLRSLLHGQGAVGRLILGIVMGLLPCGLVYAMLAIVAGLPTPWHSAVGMVVFGLGTLPSLTAVVLTHRLVPARVRAHGTKLAAVVVILTGSWMMARHFFPHEHGTDDHATGHVAHAKTLAAGQ